MYCGILAHINIQPTNLIEFIFVLFPSCVHIVKYDRTLTYPHIHEKARHRHRTRNSHWIMMGRPGWPSLLPSIHKAGRRAQLSLNRPFSPTTSLGAKSKRHCRNCWKHIDPIPWSTLSLILSRFIPHRTSTKHKYIYTQMNMCVFFTFYTKSCECFLRIYDYFPTCEWHGICSITNVVSPHHTCFASPSHDKHIRPPSMLILLYGRKGDYDVHVINRKLFLWRLHNQETHMLVLKYENKSEYKVTHKTITIIIIPRAKRLWGVIINNIASTNMFPRSYDYIRSPHENGAIFRIHRNSSRWLLDVLKPPPGRRICRKHIV